MRVVQADQIISNAVNIQLFRAYRNLTFHYNFTSGWTIRDTLSRKLDGRYTKLNYK
jgi:hypothetical protein